MKSWNIWLLLLLVGVASNCMARTIYTHSMKGLVNVEGNGAYQKLFLSMQEQYTLLPSDFVIQPLKRARKTFRRDIKSCFLSGNISSARPFILSDLLGRVRLHIFTLKHSLSIKSFSDITINQKIGGMLGIEMAYQSVVPKSVTIKYALSDDINIAKLKLGRISGLLAFLPDLSSHLHELNYDPEFILKEGGDRLYCHITKDNHDYVDRVNASLKFLKKSGDYKKIMGSFYLPFN